MATQTGLVCPKCGSRMLEYERTGILVEQCQECRGIFLDLGELERLIDAEGGGWSGRIVPPTQEPAPGDAEPKPRVDRARRGRESMKQREETLSSLRDLFGDD
jgi:Zn-finger nucleic acid-binding protein